jgi:cardiolipin synthase
VPGNRVELLEGGEQFFPRVFDSINEAQREVLIETFILFEDKIGNALHAALVAAGQARRRGPPDDRRLWRARPFAGVHLRADRGRGQGARVRSEAQDLGLSHQPVPPAAPQAGRDRRQARVRRRHQLLGRPARRLRADGQARSCGRGRRADRGADRALCRDALTDGSPPRHWFHHRRQREHSDGSQAVGPGEAIFVTRDNREHTNDIERHYRIAIRAAKKRVWIANAYFFPGWSILRQLRRAARRGVDVRIIVQGEPDMAIVKFGASMLYHHLLRAGVHIHEYTERPMHSKIALTDDEWATVGSSNLDPLSLSLNLEANVVIRDRDFNRKLAEHLETLMQSSCDEVCADRLNEPRIWVAIRNFFVFHLLRRFPAWAGWLPAHTPKLAHARDRLPDGTEEPGGRRAEQGAT